MATRVELDFGTPGSSVTVNVSGTNTPATLYKDAAETTPLANPVTVSPNGWVFFAVAGGRYDLIESGNGTNQITISVEETPKPATTLQEFNEQGRFYVAGSSVEAGGALAVDRPCFRLHNPAGSGVLVAVTALSIYSTVAQQIIYREDATLGGTPVVITPQPLNRASSRPASTLAQRSVTAPTGGTAWPNQSRVFTTSPLALGFPAPILLPPGKSFVIDFQSSAAQTTTMNAYFVERDL